ncbi:universal stress protein [Maribacter confluentis]|uniref:Universal stress protein n=1 Tax=Maribacter confluentis TaxID=1656093 RepID=A0ABT8RPB7_9FLAO|nr:universal stress protein [Maribacter confluentis]MDO1512706.1 universal stress protein [Maribacter confluentis]
MKTKKYKIVIFTELKDSLENTLKSTLNLAKVFKGEIALFHVKKATDVVKKESQLSAMRNLNAGYMEMEKQINAIVNTYSKKFGVPLSYSCAIGNVKHEIEHYIDNEKPDFIVMGKRKPKLFNLLGDHIIPFVLKKHHGPVFFTDQKNVLELNGDLSLGMLSDSEENSLTELVTRLVTHTQKPLKSFKISKNSIPKSSEKEEIGTKNIEFVFDKNDNTSKTISNYITFNKVNLLCVDRGELSTDKKGKSFSTTTNITDILDNLNIPLLLTGQITKN